MSSTMTEEEKAKYFQNRCLYERPLCSDVVVSIIEDMEPVPKDSSVMSVDLVSMCTPVHSALQIMTCNSPTKDHQVLSDYYAHNPVTGQRQMVRSMPLKPRPKKLLYIGDGNFVNSSVYCIMPNHNDRSGRTSSYAPSGLVYQWGSKTIRPPKTDALMWFVHDGIGVLLEKGVVKSYDSLIEYRAGDCVDDDKIRAALDKLGNIIHFDEFVKFR